MSMRVWEKVSSNMSWLIIGYCWEVSKYEISAKNNDAFSRKWPKTSFFDIFFDLTAVNMQKSPYSLYKSCRQWSIEHFCEVWSLYLENFSRKIIFSAYWLQSNREMASKWVKMKFLELGVNRKVVGNVENYLNMKFQPKNFTRSRENSNFLCKS